MTPVKNVAVVYRPDSEPALKLAQDLCHWLDEKELHCFSHPKQKLTGVSKLKPKQNLDLVVVLGGDGTYLEAVRMLGIRSIPMLGVNLGSLGFLTVHRAQELYDVVEMALKGKLEKLNRSMIDISISRKGKSQGHFLALNDLVIERGSTSHLIHLAMQLNGQKLNALKADGLIISTPTGSTAYNLAAGGPILQPTVDALTVTAICPHSLTNRPLIFSDKYEISFCLIGKNRAMLSVDGVKVAEMTEHDEVKVRRSKQEHWMLRKPGHNYFQLLREKLKFGERA
jgi:NAD+ kinase